MDTDIKNSKGFKGHDTLGTGNTEQSMEVLNYLYKILATEFDGSQNKIWSRTLAL